MITISDYMAYIMKELVEARRLCDSESLRMASQYANDEYLRYFPAPRFKLSEIEINVPISVSDFDFEEQIALASSESVFVQTVKTQLDSQIFKIQALAEREIGTDLSEVYPLLNEWYAELKKCTTWDSFHTCFDQYFEKITRLMRPVMLLPVGKEINTAAAPTLSPINLREHLKRQIRVTGKSLKKVMIEPDSNTVSRFGNDFALMHIKAKITEEGIIKTTFTGSDGKEKPMINFE
jgi:hypothetical protein